MKNIVIIGMVIILSGCAGASINSQIREPPKTHNENMMLRCVELKTGNDADINQQLKKYDGWKMVYISQYTTIHKVSTEAVICFEKRIEK